MRGSGPARVMRRREPMAAEPQTAGRSGRMMVRVGMRLAVSGRALGAHPGRTRKER